MMDWLTAHGALEPFLDGVVHGAALTLYTSSLAFSLGLVLGVVLLILRAAGGPVARQGRK